jgi:hypothetical protein
LNGHLLDPVDEFFTGSIHRLWPSTGDSFDFGGLPLIARDRLRWVRYPSRPFSEHGWP